MIRWTFSTTWTWPHINEKRHKWHIQIELTHAHNHAHTHTLSQHTGTHTHTHMFLHTNFAEWWCKLIPLYSPSIGDWFLRSIESRTFCRSKDTPTQTFYVPCFGEWGFCERRSLCDLGKFGFHSVAGSEILTYFGSGPLPGFQWQWQMKVYTETPTKHAIILLVAVTKNGPHPPFFCLYEESSGKHHCLFDSLGGFLSFFLQDTPMCFWRV